MFWNFERETLDLWSLVFAICCDLNFVFDLSRSGCGLSIALLTLRSRYTPQPVSARSAGRRRIQFSRNFGTWLMSHVSFFRPLNTYMCSIFFSAIDIFVTARFHLL